MTYGSRLEFLGGAEQIGQCNILSNPQLAFRMVLVAVMLQLVEGR